MKPIGTFYCEESKAYDVPRQAILNTRTANIQLHPGQNYHQALEDIVGFSHIWLLYLFDNSTWKPKVQTPRDLSKKGVFATRSPYRPNPIGMSLVKLIEVNQLSITIQNFDLLDGTQILDIKPYISDYDVVNNSTSGWLDDVIEYNIEFKDLFLKKVKQLKNYDADKVIAFIKNQLTFAPVGHPNKRVKLIADNSYELAYQYLRISFTLNNTQIIISDVMDSLF